MMLDGIPETAFGLHAQQAAEKLIKALINEHGVKYRPIHQIYLLIVELQRLGEVLPATPYPLVDLSDYARAFRYEDGILTRHFPTKMSSTACEF